MLSDRDRRTLHDLERRLMTDDAGFVRGFDATAPPPRSIPPARTTPPARSARPTGTGAAQIVGTLVLGVVMLLAGSGAGALAFFAAATAIGAAWWCTRDPSPH